MLSIQKIKIMIFYIQVLFEKSMQNEVSHKVLYCRRSRENGPYQYCCTSKLLLVLNSNKRGSILLISQLFVPLQIN
jgi:hypothetical protein